MHRAPLLLLALVLTSAAAPPPLPKAVTSFGGAVCEGAVYVYGGHMGLAHDYSKATVSGALHRLSLTKMDAWEDLPGNVPLQSPGVVSWKGKVYLAGGMQPQNESGAKSQLFSMDYAGVFDPDKGAWTPLPPLPQPRSSHAVAVVNDKLYAVGGWPLEVGRPKGENASPAKSSDSGYHDTVAVLDLDHPAAGWKSLPQPFKRRALAGAAFQGKIWCMGGMTEENEVTSQVDVFDTATSQWSKGPDVPGNDRVKGFGCAACATDDALYVSPQGDKVFRLSADGKGWVECGKMAKPRYFHVLVPLAVNKLLAIGGTRDGKPMDDVEVINITAPQ